jgi:hypothetical protein
MAYLSTTASVDAILTVKGRQLLASGNFSARKFAMSDDSIDYGLLALEDGEDRILDTKILEAGTLGEDNNAQLKYKLIIDESGKDLVAQLDIQPSIISGVVYQSFIIRVNTINGGRDESYTVYNNNSNLSINPTYAITQLNKQTYINSSGKNYSAILNILKSYESIYGKRVSDKAFEPEQAKTVKNGTDVQQSFFVFASAPFTTSTTIRVVGNDSGSVANLTISKITILPEADSVDITP